MVGMELMAKIEITRFRRSMTEPGLRLFESDCDDENLLAQADGKILDIIPMVLSAS